MPHLSNSKLEQGITSKILTRKEVKAYKTAKKDYASLNANSAKVRMAAYKVNYYNRKRAILAKLRVATKPPAAGIEAVLPKPPAAVPEPEPPAAIPQTEEALLEQMLAIWDSGKGPKRPRVTGKSLVRLVAPCICKDVANHVHASMVILVRKLYREGSPERTIADRVAALPGVQVILDCDVFADHRRCEANYELDGGAMHLYELAKGREHIARIKMALCKAVLLPHDGMLGCVADTYLAETGRDLWMESPQQFSPTALLDSLKNVSLDQAYPQFRRNFWETERARQRQNPGPLPEMRGDGAVLTKALFVNWFAHLLRTGRFEQALSQCVGNGTPLRTLLEDTLLIHTPWHRMLVAREMAVLLPTMPRKAGAIMVYVGSGAANVVVSALGRQRTNKESQEELQRDLVVFHNGLEGLLDMELVRLVCPRGWTIDMTEHAGCEKRRYDDALQEAARGKKPHRTRNKTSTTTTTVEERQKTRCRRLMQCFEMLGFVALPSCAVTRKGKHKHAIDSTSRQTPQELPEKV